MFSPDNILCTFIYFMWKINDIFLEKMHISIYSYLTVHKILWWWSMDPIRRELISSKKLYQAYFILIKYYTFDFNIFQEK